MAAEVRPIVQIRLAEFPADKPIVSHLFLAYAQSLPIKLDFQNFDDELASLPGKYAAESGGGVWLACTSSASPKTNTENSLRTEDEENVIGCVALRAFPAPTPTCELKRLYLTPESRGMGVSKVLMDEVLRRARELRYKEMLLDTLSSMTAAKRLYEGYAFVETGKYYDSVDGAVFYKLLL
ncbi:acyl-CoA N-acyltransferase [Setomelanomma holmii]|uniref:Acyl-CoA N-acyltransferase n=1 Tax=Setomelanomma holmii TaxID=210430 RepID=A0A9P4LQF2_9PLEO|nr:acyl-CoA N-acyltransferase [Setomelanomma holmii]